MSYNKEVDKYNAEVDKYNARLDRGNKLLHESELTLGEISDLICEYCQDGARTEKRDVLDWWKWMERKFRVKKSYIFFGKKAAKKLS